MIFHSSSLGEMNKGGKTSKTFDNFLAYLSSNLAITINPNH